MKLKTWWVYRDIFSATIFVETKNGGFKKGEAYDVLAKLLEEFGPMCFVVKQHVVLHNGLLKITQQPCLRRSRMHGESLVAK